MRRSEVWKSGESYEGYVGRWSRLVAREFLRWLDVPQGSRWLDVGCGTGALSETIVDEASPALVVGVDPSEGFILHARKAVAGAEFRVADAQQLPFQDGRFDATVSGLVLNFVPEPKQAAAEEARVTRSGGVVGAYVWDYGEGMELMRYFWDAAAAVEAGTIELDEGRRFPICCPEALKELFEAAGLDRVETRPIDVETRFRDLKDYWSPFLGGQGPAPAYLVSLTEERREAVRQRLDQTLPRRADGSIVLTARAWAVRGRKS